MSYLLGDHEGLWDKKRYLHHRNRVDDGRPMKKKNKHAGSSLASFMKEEVKKPFWILDKIQTCERMEAWMTQHNAHGLYLDRLIFLPEGELPEVKPEYGEWVRVPWLDQPENTLSK